MKLILLVPSLTRGGSERFISNLSIALSKEHQVIVAVFENQVDYPIGGRLVDFALPPKANRVSRVFNVLRRCMALKKLVRTEKPDVVLSVMKAGNRINTLCRTKGVLRFLSCRGFADLEAAPRVFLEGAERTDGIIFNSKECRDFFCKRCGGPEEKAFYNYNLIDFKRIEQDRSAPVGEPALEAFLQTYRCVVCMGRLTEIKGQRELIKAFELVSRRIPDCGLILIGGNGDQREFLMNLAEQSSCRERIYFTGDRENPYNVLAQCWIYALPSKAEGFPNALVEAMACGLCVVSSDCRTGPGEILRREPGPHTEETLEIAEYGILTPPLQGREEVFAQALELALTDTALHDKLSKAAVKRAAAFSPNKALKDFLEIVSGSGIQQNNNN